MCKLVRGHFIDWAIVPVSRKEVLMPFALLQVVCEVGKAVGAEGLVAGQIVDIKSEGMAEQVTSIQLSTECPAPCQTRK